MILDDVGKAQYSKSMRSIVGRSKARGLDFVTVSLTRVNRQFPYF